MMTPPEVIVPAERERPGPTTVMAVTSVVPVPLALVALPSVTAQPAARGAVLVPRLAVAMSATPVVTAVTPATSIRTDLIVDHRSAHLVRCAR